MLTRWPLAISFLLLEEMGARRWSYSSLSTLATVPCEGGTALSWLWEHHPHTSADWSLTPADIAICGAFPWARPVNGDELQIGASLPSLKELFSLRFISVLWLSEWSHECFIDTVEQLIWTSSWSWMGWDWGRSSPSRFIAEIPILWQCSLSRLCKWTNTQSQLKVRSGSSVLNYWLAMLTQER